MKLFFIVLIILLIYLFSRNITFLVERVKETLSYPGKLRDYIHCLDIFQIAIFGRYFIRSYEIFGILETSTIIICLNSTERKFNSRITSFTFLEYLHRF